MQFVHKRQVSGQRRRVLAMIRKYLYKVLKSLRKMSTNEVSVQQSVRIEQAFLAFFKQLFYIRK